MIYKNDALPGLPHPGCPLSSNSGVAFLASRATRSSSDCTNSYTAYIHALQTEMVFHISPVHMISIVFYKCVLVLNILLQSDLIPNENGRREGYLGQILTSDGHVGLWDLLPCHFHSHISREPKDCRQQALFPQKIQAVLVVSRHLDENGHRRCKSERRGGHTKRT